MTKRNFVILIAFGFTSMLIILESCKKDDDIIDSGRTALDHAYECEEVLGPLPKFSCADAVEVPTTKNGSPVTFPTGEEGNGSTNPNECDIHGLLVWLVKQAIKLVGTKVLMRMVLKIQMLYL